MIPRVLALCACDRGHDAMYERLDGALARFRQSATDALWNRLLHEAEQQGLAPLLHKHIQQLGAVVPTSFRRPLHSLSLRHRHASGVRNRVVSEILDAYETAGIQTLLLKGIALANFAYSDPALRPMRDVDLLVASHDLPRARGILGDLGWQTEEDHDIPDGYYHLPPVVKTIDGLPVTVELHGNLLPLHGGYPPWPLEKSWSTALSGTISGRAFRTLSLEDTLRAVFLHGFRAPLTYESFRLIHVADMITLTETALVKMDWERIRAEEATLPAAMSRFHFLTPLPEPVLRTLQADVSRPPRGVGLPYNGWPHRRLAHTSRQELARLARDTLWPPQWWLQLYHGHISGYRYWQARFWTHPRMLWQWAKAFSRSARKA